MATSSTTTVASTRTEDALAHLPISSITEYAKGRTIYGPEQLSTSLYLVVSGTVGISYIADDGSEVLLEVVRPDELFGEAAFLEAPRNCERATVIETAKVMTWAIADVEELVTKRPPLAVALLQIIAQRNADYTSRIGSFAIDTIERRLARSLIRFAERLGTMDETGSTSMMPFTHEMLSRYVGTSREIVSHYMNRFRKKGFVTYSRRGIRLYGDALKASIS